MAFALACAVRHEAAVSCLGSKHRSANIERHCCLDLHKFLHFVLEPVLVLATEDLPLLSSSCACSIFLPVYGSAESIAKDRAC